MPRNSAGVYTLPAGNPVVTNTPIESDGWANPTLSDIANEITNSLDRSGRGGMTGPFGVIDGTAAAPGLRFTTDPNNGLYRVGPDDWWASAGGVPVLQLQPTGITVPAAVTARWLGNPTADTDLTPKGYVDGLADAIIADVDATYLKLAGGTMAGMIYFPNLWGTITRKADNSDNQWFTGAETGTDKFGVYNYPLGRHAFLLNPTTNTMEVFFGIDIWTDAPNGINFKANASALYTFGNSTGFYLPDNVDFQVSGTLGRLLTASWDGSLQMRSGYHVGASSSPPYIYEGSPGSLNFRTGPGGGTYYYSGVDASGVINNASAGFAGVGGYSTTLDSGNAFLWSYGGQERFAIKNIESWAGLDWHMPGVAFMSMIQVSDGSLRFIGQRNVAGDILASLSTAGVFKARQIIASPSPG